MAIYKYKAKNKDGELATGLVEALSDAAAEQMLKDRNYDIISISLESEGSEKNHLLLFERIKPKDIVIFSRQFAVLISASVTLVQSLKMLVDQTENVKMKMTVSEISDEIDGGARLSDALAKRPKVFSSFYVNVIRSGETSGKLDDVLNYLADELEKDYDMSSKIKGAMIYPAFVLFSMGGIGVLMMMFIVPKLTAVIAESGGELPMPTKIVMAISAFLVSYWWLIGFAMVGIYAGIKSLRKFPFGKLLLDSILLKLPVFGKLFQRIYLVRFTRSLQTLIIGGVNISKSLSIVAEVVSNQVYKDLISQTKKEVEDGNSISTAFLSSAYIPKMVSQMMSVGEKTGKLDLVLERITDFYTREVTNIVSNLMTLMEPLIMVIMGIGTGIMVAAIIMPMYNMASQY
ncbi:type II secretion system F family protein [bacterium]|nr:type II secretion system F family protein [bacterium]